MFRKHGGDTNIQYELLETWQMLDLGNTNLRRMAYQDVCDPEVNSDAMPYRTLSGSAFA